MFFLMFVLFVSVMRIGIYAVQNIKYSQYEERVKNSNILMEKICQNVQTAVDFDWQSIHYIVKQIEDESFETMTELMDFVSICEQNVKGEANTKIVLISKDGFCYVTDGTSFKWMSPSLLNEKEDVMYVSDHQFASKTNIQMHYLSRFRTPFEVEGITFTHTSLACDMNELDRFFDVSNYGEESITFIIHQNGSHVYREEKQNTLSGIYNLLSALKEADFGYGESYEEFERDIQNSIKGSVYLTLNGTGYFVSYYPLGIKDWQVVLMAPEKQVGSETQTFTKKIIISVALLCCSLLIVLFTILSISAHQISIKRKKINEQLINVAEAERQANEAKTNFLSAMSHDIRTPMNAIIGMVTIATKRVDDVEYMRECLEKIRLASDHLLTLINNILDISKVESGKMMLNIEKFSLADSFTNLINIMLQQARERNQEISIYVHNIQNEYLLGDKLRLNQIFINVLSNAIKYTHRNGNIKIDLYEELLEGEEKCVRIKYVVKDNGMGISEEFQKTMYQSFSRASDSRTNKTQGSGLGLTICKQMVDLMNGTIDCESELGVGTTFTVTIDMPIANVEEEELSIPELEVLLLDDEEVFLQNASDTLNSLGLKVVTFSEPQLAMENIAKRQDSEKPYALIIIDEKLAEISGFDIVQQMKLKYAIKMPFTLISTYDTSSTEERAKDVGAKGVIAKPFFRSKVYDYINYTMGFKDASSKEQQKDYTMLAGKRLLVAEDNDMNWEIARTILEMYDISVERAENGRICVDMMSQATEGYYTLILMDVRMPVMDGREATRMLRSSNKEWLRKIPVIAMTADAFAEDVQECLIAGMNEHISKPLDMDRLLHVLKKYCS